MKNFAVQQLNKVAKDPNCLEEVIFQLHKYHQIESKPFTGLETSYKETQYFNETGTLILPKEHKA